MTVVLRGGAHHGQVVTARAPLLELPIMDCGNVGDEVYVVNWRTGEAIYSHTAWLRSLLSGEHRPAHGPAYFSTPWARCVPADQWSARF